MLQLSAQSLNDSHKWLTVLAGAPLQFPESNAIKTIVDSFESWKSDEHRSQVYILIEPLCQELCPIQAVELVRKT